MSKEIQIFKNDEFGQVRTTTINGEPWFVGKDVADILGYSNPRDAIAKHVDDDDRNTVAIRDGKGNPNQTIINESGLYALIIGSKLPTAKKFKRWVTSEVLPSIRKTGSYTADPLQKQRLEIDLNNSRANVAALWLEIGNLATPEYKQVCSSYASSVLSGGKEVIPLPECKIDRYYSAAEIAAALGITANRVGKIANQNGLKTAEYGKWFFDKSPYSNKEVQTFRYTRKAVDAIRKLV
jgi:prophage antirepressor-like protein